MTNFTKPHRNLVRGFTLVELLIVITIIGILAGVLTSIINPVQQRRNAEDGIRRSNMNKLVMAIEAYFSGETGVYPTEAERTTATSKFRSVYLTRWPDGEPTGSTYTYNNTGSAFGVAVNKAATTGCIKYRSDRGRIQDCTDCNPANSNCIP